MIPISHEVLKEEVDLAIRILLKWQQRLGPGIPGKDIPAAEEVEEIFTRELVSELLVVSGKLENLANVISSSE